MTDRLTTGSGARGLIETLRRLVMGVLLLGLTGTAIELVLLGHYEDAWQWLPLALIAAGFVAVAWQLSRPSRASLRFLRVTMAAFVLAGGLGVALHYRGSLAFQLEMDPQQTRSQLFWKVIRAKAPPALAPGLMTQLGLLGLIYGYRYPASSPADGRALANMGG